MWLFLWIASAFAEDLWTTTEVTATRWLGSPTTTVTVPVGSKVTVVLRDKDQVRVRFQQDYGWISASVLTSTPPVPATVPDDGEAPGEFPKVTLTPGEAGK